MGLPEFFTHSSTIFTTARRIFGSGDFSMREVRMTWMKFFLISIFMTDSLVFTRSRLSMTNSLVTANNTEEFERTLSRDKIEHYFPVFEVSTQAHVHSQMVHKSQRQGWNMHQKWQNTAEDMNHKIQNPACWKWGKRDWVLAWRVVAERRWVMSLVWPLNAFSAWFAQGKMWLFWWVEPLGENMLEADFQFAADSCCEEVLGDAVRVTLQCEAFQTEQDRQGREHANVCESVQSHLHVPFKNHNSI